MTNEQFQEHVKSVLWPVVKAIVDSPDKASISSSQGEQTTVFELRVDKSDLGKVIGKKGRMAESLRMILFSLSAKNGKRSVMEIVE